MRIQAGTRSDEVRDRLLSALLVGEYLPGTRLPAERELAQRLSVSRVTMRTALQEISSAGLLEVRVGRGGGYFVTTNRVDDTAAARALRERFAEIKAAIDGASRIQGAICEAAAENRNFEDLRLLELRLSEFESAESGRAKQIADSNFHMAICEAAHVPALTDALMFLEQRVSLSAPHHPWGIGEEHARMEARALQDHRRLLDLIRQKMTVEASRLAQVHAQIDLEMIESARRYAEKSARAVRSSTECEC
ncbi:GntR family transcriptional regulator [Corynebacterium sp. SCR221107]|uniref:FadR/GntR family transcriptional regulator n=1 Tax=Corynebacterium sp. SCR221107 TaxID=3017361 RepID=UPI0022EC4238|nr:GntR family transcriptional regulator [Corynebacterium sp. SCR221107]WBT08710.1 GntR family transcriptional regulator [Corynebacterium sp. SCR221107]